MSDTPATNGTAFRLAALERRLDRVENMEPAVMKQEIHDVKEELKSISDEIGGMRRLLLGFIATFALSGITVLVSIGTILVGR